MQCVFFEPAHATMEDKEDIKEDLKDFAETLTEHGNSWEGMSNSQRAEFHRQFESHGLDLQSLLKQELRRNMKEKVQDLKISWSDIHVLELIGQGGYGKVYRGHWSSLEVAVKEFSQVHLTQPVKRVVHHEAYVMSLLRPPNIAVLYGLVDEGKHFALVMEYYGRGSLAQTLESNLQLSWSWKRRVLMDVARGMSYLHSCPYESVVHGDLKPDNILLNDKGVAIVADFGVSRVQSYTNTINLTSPGASVVYAAPELFRNPSCHRQASSDVYSFAMVAFAIAI
mmetsp:Transcript_9715/g.58932  ORF Transcript_9715/g.58932 Transcript_9715/m.58932 type:complete len:282 (+) Transcript_9715:3029-3874(+)